MENLLLNPVFYLCITPLVLIILKFLRWYITFKAFKKMDKERIMIIDSTSVSKEISMPKNVFIATNGVKELLKLIEENRLEIEKSKAPKSA